MMLVGAKFGIAGALLTLVVSVHAGAEELAETVDLTWNAPADCPSDEQVLEDVARIVGGRHGDRVSVKAEVDVAPTESGRWRASLSLEARGAYGEREFEAESCVAVASAAALIIAVTVDGGMSPPASSPQHVVVEAPAPQATPAPATVGRFVSRGIATAAGLVDVGTMPEAPTAGAETALGWTFESSRWRIRAQAGAGFFPTQDAPSAIAGQGGRFWLLTAFARLCAAIRRGPLDVGPCLGGEIDRMSASGTGPDADFQPGSATGIWGAVVFGGGASWTLSPRVALLVRAEGVLPTFQPRFVLQPGDILVHTPSRLSGRMAMGLELRFF